MAEVLNQFTYDDVKGRIDNGDKGLGLSAKLSGTANAGDFVKIKTVAGSKVLVVEVITVNTDECLGVIPYESSKKNAYIDGDMISVNGDYSIIVCEASAAVSAGITLMPVVSGMKVAAQTVGLTAIGTALQPATADGDLIKVLIKRPLTVAS